MAALPRRNQIHFLTQTLRVAGPGILAGLVILLLLAGIFAAQPWYITQDLQGSTVSHGVGKVTGLYYQHKQPAATVLVEVNGVRAPIQTSEPVQIGQKVRVFYRLGKSGRMYISNIVPSSAP